MEFPEFKPIELNDRAFIQNKLWTYQPAISELTFTNLFIWRFRYGIQWSTSSDCLFLLCSVKENEMFAFPPVGPPSRAEAVRSLLRWLRDERGIENPSIQRADNLLVKEIEGETDFDIEPILDHFDYVYRTADLIRLAGRKYHKKKNHINSFRRTYSSRYVPLDGNLIQGCLDTADRWCAWRRCEEELNLMDEWEAVKEALLHFSELRLQGGVVLVKEKVEAFSIGELLNRQTAVIHVEKANPDIRGLFPAINQAFCEYAWQDVEYINREQDLGEPGLRKAKKSYYPDRLEEKFRIRLKK